VVDARRVETSSPLSEGMKIAKKVAEMLLHDIPNVKLDEVQVDVYTSFRSLGSQSETRCILSTQVRRDIVQYIDWEETEPLEFITLTEGRFSGDGSALLPVEPLEWPSLAAQASRQEPGE
jgi:hypothetical protein